MIVIGMTKERDATDLFCEQVNALKRKGRVVEIAHPLKYMEHPDSWTVTVYGNRVTLEASWYTKDGDIFGPVFIEEDKHLIEEAYLPR